MTVELMHRTGSLNWLVEETQVQVLQLPYVNSTLGTIILLPVGTADVGQVRMLMCSEDAGVWAHAHDVCLMLMYSEDAGVCAHAHDVCLMLMCSEDAGVCAHAHDVCFVTIVLPVTDSIRFSSSARCCESKGRTSRSP